MGLGACAHARDLVIAQASMTCVARAFVRTVSCIFNLFYMCTCMYPCAISVSWSVICCQDSCTTAFAKGALPEEYLSHNFDEQCVGGDLFDVFPTLVGGHH